MSDLMLSNTHCDVCQTFTNSCFISYGRIPYDYSWYISHKEKHEIGTYLLLFSFGFFSTGTGLVTTELVLNNTVEILHIFVW